METETTSDASVIVIDSDDDISTDIPRVSDFFRNVKKSARKLGFDKKLDSVNSPFSSKLRDDIFENTVKQPVDPDLQRVSPIESPVNDNCQNSSSEATHQDLFESESDSDLDIPLSRRLASKRNKNKPGSSNSQRNFTLIALDDDSESVKTVSDVTETSNDIFYINETNKYEFTTILEKKDNTKSLLITADEEVISVKGIKKRTPKKKQRCEESKTKECQKPRKVEKKRLEDANLEFRKCRNIEEALKECATIIDSDLCQKYFRKGELETAFQQKVLYEMTDKPLIKNCVVWKRLNKVEETLSDDDSIRRFPVKTDEFEDHMLVIFDADTIRQMVNSFLLGDGCDSPTLIDFVKKAFHQFKKNLTLIFYGLETYYRRIANNENKKFRNGVFADQRQKTNCRKRESLPPLRREDVEEMIVCMQLALSNCAYSKLRVTVRVVEGPSDLAKIIFLYTKTVAGKPLKENRLEEHGYAWYVTGDVKGSVDVKCPEDVTKLWIQQLMQFPKISHDIAKSIAAKYPSLFSLASIYRAETDKITAETLLSDIKIIRRGDVTNRKVGIELSKRIHKYITSNDPHVLLN